MGGLRKYMPLTRWTFLIATIAITGIFPFSGFFSKDEILGQALHTRAFGFLTLTPGSQVHLTSGAAIFGSSRRSSPASTCGACYLTFSGEYRGPESVHPHESPSVDDVAALDPRRLSIVLALVSGCPPPGCTAAGCRTGPGSTTPKGSSRAPAASRRGVRPLSRLRHRARRRFGGVGVLVCALLQARLRRRHRATPASPACAARWRTSSTWTNSTAPSSCARLERSPRDSGAWWTPPSSTASSSTASASLVAWFGGMRRRFQNGDVQRYAAVTALGVAALLYVFLVRG